MKKVPKDLISTVFFLLSEFEIALKNMSNIEAE